MMRIGIIMALCILMGACADRNSAISDSLRQEAGANVGQLEAVLAHYAGDPLRLRAAEFLIGNMEGHYSYADSAGARRYYDALDSALAITPDMPGQQLRALTDSLGAIHLPDRRMVPDASVVTAGFLIRSIDEAFELWENDPWARHVTFPDFCELLLPYKLDELQPTECWRGSIAEIRPDDMTDIQYCDERRNLTLHAAELMNAELCRHIGMGVEEREFSYPVMRPSTLLRVPSGTCRNLALAAALAMRAQGIPVAIDFTPLWAAGGNSHTWCAVLATSGKMEAFSPPFTTPGNVDRINDRPVKVYRRTYAPDPLLRHLNLTEPYVPPTFRTWFLKDVTEEYAPHFDVTVEAEGAGHAYLALFNNRAWEPVAVAPVKGGKAIFPKVGGGALFLPIAYDEKGGQIALGKPFTLSMTGEIRHVEASPDSVQTLTLRRKFPVRTYVYEVARRIRDGEFQASDRPDFSRITTVHRITDCASEGHSILLPDSIGAFRYWRYIQNRPGTFSNMAEIAFYRHASDTTAVRGRIIGTEGSFENEPDRSREAAFDGNFLTYFNPPEWSGCWAGMDFGEPVRLERIDFTPRGDGNTIEPDDLYELCLWDACRWLPLARLKAPGVSLTFPDVPADGLYLLHNLTKGSEERPFTYESGRQVWW